MSFPENYGLVAAGLQGIFGILIASRMSLLRFTRTPFTSDVFKKWHSAQLNVTEYNATLMVIYGLLHFDAKSKDRELSQIANIFITIGLLSQPVFTAGALSKQRVSPLRVVGAGMRYLSIVAMCFELIRSQQ
eukprot:TRINITY_DN2601_c0_g1_i1.p2 TRINITY_DN2601_c0_g1~~TRINITY_DN2601_c0_g1_i1.p2  ORF type:complete len:132 (+),score=28.23 TRINITY_DN2601_c0_g1_i1:548-943(+)